MATLRNIGQFAQEPYGSRVINGEYLLLGQLLIRFLVAEQPFYAAQYLAHRMHDAGRYSSFCEPYEGISQAIESITNAIIHFVPHRCQIGRAFRDQHFHGRGYAFDCALRRSDD